MAKKITAKPPLPGSDDFQYKTLIQTIPDIMYEIDVRGRFVFVSDAIKDFGYNPRELIGKHFKSIIDPKEINRVSREKVLPKYKGKITGDEYSPKLFDERRTGKRMTKNLETRLLLKKPKKNNTFRYVEIHSCGKWEEDGKGRRLIGSIGIMRDITKTKTAELALNQEKERARKYLDTAGVIMLALDTKGIATLVNNRGCEILGWPQEYILGKNWFDHFLPRESAVAVKTIFRRLIAEEIENTEYVQNLIVDRNGEQKMISWHNVVLRDEKNRIVGTLSSGEDITESRRAQELLQKSYAMTQEMLKYTPFGVWVVNQEGMVEYVNPAMVDISGDTYEQLKETNIFKCDNYKKTDLCDKIETLFAKGESFFLNYVEFTSAYSKKSTLVNFYGIPLKEENTVKALLFTEDLTGIKQAGEALQLKDKAMDSSINAIVMADLEGSITYVNSTFISMLGFTSLREAIDHPLKDFVSDDAQIQKMIDAVRNKGSWVGEIKARRKDASILDCQASSNMVKDDSGNPICIMVSLIDISEQKRIEAQLLQSQKMETIGRLAGGVAHDFNNLLTAMMNYATLAKYRIKPEDPAQEDLEQIIKVAKRAANLTHQLLSFSRRQIISLKPVDINEFVLNMDKMLRRLIREEIELVVIPQDTGFANADVGQLEQILVNLVVNARDAISAKGKITITMGNIKLAQAYSANNTEIDAGDYVWLSVKDTGSGMDENVKKHLFEPFFTTKEIGKGTGLGLATVYGIVKQHQGNIEVISEPGYGTEMKIYFPRTFDIQAESGSGGKEQVAMLGHETIFVVEDEPLVRDAVVRILEKLGYKVFSAGNGLEAMSLAQEHSEQIHLLLTDVVMPQMSGIELSRKFRIIYPGIKVLLVSGYTDDMSVLSFLDKSQAFLQKPFTEDVLARKLRDLLG
jgi:PAS domain S-box-containing protein